MLPNRLVLGSFLCAFACHAILTTAGIAQEKKVPPPAPTEAELAKFRAEVQKLFDVDPKSLTKVELQWKSKAISEFMDRLAKDKKKNKQNIRALLARPDKLPSAFILSGSQFLLEDQSPTNVNQTVKLTDDHRLAAKALGTCALGPVSPPMYFGLVHMLAWQGADVSAALHRILDHAAFRVYLVAHVFTLRQDLCALYLTTLMDEKHWLPGLLTRLQKEKSPTAVRSILIAVYEAETKKGRAAIATYAKKGLVEDGRKLARRLTEIEWKPAPDKLRTKRKHLFESLKKLLDRDFEDMDFDWETFYAEAIHLVRAEDVPKLKAMRKKQARRLSDEAVQEIMFVSRLIHRAASLGR